MWGVWPEQFVQDSEKEVTKYYKQKFAGKIQQNKRSNITIITSNLPVNNTVRFETDSKNGHAKRNHVSLFKPYNFYSIEY